MAIVLNDNLNILAPKPVDNKYGIWESGSWRPFNDTSEVLSSLVFYRYKGLTVSVSTDTGTKEYWFRDGILDEDLVEKYPNQELSWDPGTGILEITLGNDVNLDGRYALLSTLISAGTGLTGGGSLAADRTLSFDTVWGDARYALKSHTHPISDIINLQSELDSKEPVFSKGSIISGNNISITGDLSNRLVGSGDIVINSLVPVYPIFNRTDNGLVPAPGGTTSTRYLREDGSWVTPAGTEYINMTLSELNTGTATTARTISAKTLTDWIAARTYTKTESNNLFAPIVHTHEIGDIINLQSTLDSKVNKSNSITSGYGITASPDFSGPVSIEVNTSTLDNRYLRKDANDTNSTYTLTLGNLISGGVNTSSLTLPSLSTSTEESYLVVDSNGNVSKRSINIMSSFDIGDNDGVSQFPVGHSDQLRFSGSGDTSISFNPSTKTITITSIPGAGGGGVVTSVFGRQGGVTAQLGDYSTSLVTEGSNLYFTEGRVLDTALTGLTLSTSPIVATDSILQALGKVQGQINNSVTNTVELTVSGTAGRIIVSGGAQDLTANREWVIDLVATGVTAGTYTKVTVDNYGRVTSGASLVAGDIPNLPASKITSGTFSTARIGTGSALPGTYVDGATGEWTPLPTTDFTNYYTKLEVDNLLGDKQDTLISGVNIKTINGVSVLGSGNILIDWDSIEDKPSLFPPSAHTHNASDINSGVLNIARIPTGTTSSTVALGNHTHTFASITSKPDTISGYGITDAYTQSEIDDFLDDKFDNPTGTTSQYIRGDGTLGVFPSIAEQFNPSAGAGISITGTYPNLTITNTSPNATHTGDVTGDSTLTISNNAVTFSKMQNISSGVLLGRYSSSTGNIQTISLGAGLSLNTSTGVLSSSGSEGTVKSIGLSLPNIFNVSNSPVTTTGTITASLVNQTSNTVFAGPTSGSGAPTFRSLVQNDIPSLPISKITNLQSTLDGKEDKSYKVTSIGATPSNTNYPSEKAVADYVAANIPAAQVNSDWDATSGVAEILNKPTIGDGTLTLATGTGLTGSASFSANQTGTATFTVGIASGYKLPTTAEWGSKQDNLVSGTTIKTINGTSILGSGNIVTPNDNTTYTAGDGLTLTGTEFSVPVSVTGTGTFVSNITQTASGIAVTLGTPSNTTYSSMSAAEINAGTATTARTISSKVLNDWLNGKNYLTTVAWGDVTGKPSTFTPSAHTHAAGDITSGVLNIARIPTGTTSSTVALGNHTHTFASITSKPTTLSGYGITNAYTKTEVDGLIGDIGVGVTSVAMSVPTGFSISGSPITSTGTLALTYASGYQGFTTAQSTKLAGIEEGANNYTLPVATATVRGGIELFSNTVQSVAANAVSATANRTYGIQLNSAGQAVVNVPWTNTNTTYSAGAGLSLDGTTFTNTAPNATHTGDVTGSTTLTIANNVVTHAKYQNIPTQRILGRGATGTGNVQELTLGSNLTLSTAGVLSATNTNTTYSAGTGLTLSGTTFNVSYGTSAGTSAQGNDSRIINGQTAYGWGDHADAGYQEALVSGTNIKTVNGVSVLGSGNIVTPNNTYTAGSGLTLTGSEFSIPVTVSGTGTFVTGVTQTATGLQINLGTPTNTTYSNMSAAEISAGTATTGRVVSSKTLNDWLGGRLSTKADLVDGVIPANQLPSYVDDVLEGLYINSTTFHDTNGDPYPHEDGKIYVDISTGSNKGSWRWTGTQYTKVESGGLTLGNTSSTAHRGDHGSEAYNLRHSHSNKAILDAITSSDISNWDAAFGWGNHAGLYVPTSRTLSAGNGLSGGGNLSANRTITLGTPGAITLSSTNSVTTSSHTHAFTPGGTTAQYIRGDGSLATMPTDAITSISRDGVNIPIVSQNVDIPIFSTSGAGLVPARVGSVATKYLREDGSWVTPTNTTYSNMSIAELNTGTVATGRVISASVLNQWLNAKNYYQSGDVNLPPVGGDFRVFPEVGGGNSPFDFDEIVGPGFYYQMSNPSSPNRPPVSGYYYLETHSYNTSNRTQIAWPYRAQTEDIWLRSKVNSPDWSSWYRIWSSRNFDPNSKQDELVSGTTIKTINGTSILGSGNIVTTNTTYSAGTGLSLSGTTFGQAITTSGTGSFVTGITQTTNGFQVNLGTPPNTTYSSGTLALLQAGTNTSNRVWSAKILTDFTDGKYLQLSGGTVTGQIKRTTDAVSADDVPRLGQVQSLIDNLGQASNIFITSDLTLDWQNDMSYDEEGNVTSKTWAQRYGNSVFILRLYQDGSVWRDESDQVAITMSGNEIQTVSFHTVMGNTRITITGKGGGAPTGVFTNRGEWAPDTYVRGDYVTAPSRSNPLNTSIYFLVGSNDYVSSTSPTTDVSKWSEVPAAAGPKGDIGDTGPKGDTGPAGPGVPTGGTAGQILAKVNSTNFNTQWINLPATDWSDILNKPSTFAPSAHTHNASDINAGTLAAARIPNLNASKITAGTLAIARIPTGTTSSTVALGNDSRINNGQTAFGWGNHASAGYAVSGTSGSQVRTNTQLDARFMQSSQVFGTTNTTVRNNQQLDGRYLQPYTVPAILTANKTLSASDKNAYIRVTGTRTLTIPAGLSTTDYPIGSTTNVRVSTGATVTFAGASGVTLDHPDGTGNVSVEGRKVVSIVRVDTNAYDLIY